MSNRKTSSGILDLKRSSTIRSVLVRNSGSESFLFSGFLSLSVEAGIGFVVEVEMLEVEVLEAEVEVLQAEAEVEGKNMT